MTFFEVIKAIKKGYWYQVPSDIHGHSNTDMDHKDTVRQLTYLRNYWATRENPVTFEMGEPKEQAVWDKAELKMLVKQVVRITMTNSVISTFNPLD